MVAVALVVMLGFVAVVFILRWVFTATSVCLRTGLRVIYAYCFVRC